MILDSEAEPKPMAERDCNRMSVRYRITSYPTKWERSRLLGVHASSGATDLGSIREEKQHPLPSWAPKRASAHRDLVVGRRYGSNHSHSEIQNQLFASNTKNRD